MFNFLFSQKLYFFQIERDDAYTEIEILKEKLDKSLYASQKLIDEKDNSNKEFEKMLEKYDRCDFDFI
jgi:golgin subfamily B member 1